MSIEHPRTALVPYLRGELGPNERHRVATHLAGCDECRREVEAFQEILAGLRESTPAPPEIHWGRWRAELTERLEDKRGRRAPGRRWWLHPVPVALSVAIAGLLLVLAWPGGIDELRRRDLPAWEEAAVGDRFGLLRHLALVERLELLEDYELISQLDHLEPGKES